MQRIFILVVIALAHYFLHLKNEIRLIFEYPFLGILWLSMLSYVLYSSMFKAYFKSIKNKTTWISELYIQDIRIYRRNKNQ